MSLTGQGLVVFEGEPLMAPELWSVFEEKGVTLAHCIGWNLRVGVQAHSSGGHFSGIELEPANPNGKKRLVKLVYHPEVNQYNSPH